MAQTFAWFKPAPFWQANGRDLLSQETQLSFKEPQLLQFETDNFMERLFDQAETGSLTVAQNPPLLSREPLKLFQPAHQRYYLVCSSLCCVQRGFPDRRVRLAQGESVYFVLRRRLSSGAQEWAWSTGETDPGWNSLETTPLTVPDDEERLPLFPVAATGGRTLFAGYVPVNSGETYAAAASTLPGVEEPGDPRLAELNGRFIEQVTWINQLTGGFQEAEEDIALLLSIYLLLDLWEYLHTYLPAVAEAVRISAPVQLDGAAGDLLRWLEDENQKLDESLTLAQALGTIAAKREILNQATDDEAINEFDARSDDDNSYVYSLFSQWPDPSPQGVPAELETLRDLIEASLPPGEEEDGKPELEMPKLRSDSDERYVVRCVYEQPPACEGGKPQRWISGPSREFRLASFYDPDAPVRPMKIAMPDVKMSSLRRYGKGVTMVLPESLEKAVDDIKGELEHLLPDGRKLAELGIGYMCTFSLPIITLCAFILLLVMVIVLHLVFWWIPYFIICLPIPRPSE